MLYCILGIFLLVAGREMGKVTARWIFTNFVADQFFARIFAGHHFPNETRYAPLDSVDAEFSIATMIESVTFPRPAFVRTALIYHVPDAFLNIRWKVWQLSVLTEHYWRLACGGFTFLPSKGGCLIRFVATFFALMARLASALVKVEVSKWLPLFASRALFQFRGRGRISFSHVAFSLTESDSGQGRRDGCTSLRPAHSTIVSPSHSPSTHAGRMFTNPARRSTLWHL